MKSNPRLPVTDSQVEITPTSKTLSVRFVCSYIYFLWSKQAMSGGCGRNPPPFLDNEDQEEELDTRALDSDEEEEEDEDEDIFTGARVRHLLQNE